jgi:hypothetical protein
VPLFFNSKGFLIFVDTSKNEQARAFALYPTDLIQRKDTWAMCCSFLALLGEAVEF